MLIWSFWGAIYIPFFVRLSVTNAWNCHSLYIQHSQAMLERGVCELAHSFFHFEHLWSTVRLYVTISSGTTLYWWQPLDVLWVASARGPALLLSISHLYNWYRKMTWRTNFDQVSSFELLKKKHSTSTYMNSVEYYM